MRLVRNYLHNLRLWGRGWFWLDELEYKPGWGRYSFSLVYLFNIGTQVLTGGALQTWSRSFWEWRQSGSRPAKFMDRLLQRLLGDDHGEESAPALWNSRPCRPGFRWALVVGYAVLAWLFA